MTTTTLDQPTTDVATFSRGTRVLLIGAPLLMALGRILLVPMDDQDYDGTLTKMASHAARSNTGWFFALAASGLLAVTGVILGQQLRSVGKAKSAMFSMVATALGWAGCAGICVGGLYMAAAAKAPDRIVQVQLQKDFNSGSAGFLALLSVVGVIGYIILAVALARGGLASKGAAILVAVGGAATLMTMPGPLTPLLVLTALVLAVGHALVLRSGAKGDVSISPRP